MERGATTKIRVAIMADEFDRRPERTLYFRKLIEGLLASEDIDLTLVHAKPMPDEPLYKDARVREIVLPRIPLPVATRFFSFIRFCLTTKERFDVVHWLTPRIFPFFWLFPAKKQVVMAHGGGDVLVPGIWTLARTVFNYTIIWFQKHIDVLVAVSEYANREIIYAYKVPPTKVRTIYVAVHPMYLEPEEVAHTKDILASYQLPYKSYFFFTGRFRIHKNVGNLVSAYLKYRAAHPESSYVLALAGEHAEYEETFGPVPESPFAKDIHFIGYVPTDHLPALYRGAFALSFVTLNEGFGLPVIEAMACGTPVITSSVTSLPEVAGNAGIIVNPYSPTALAQAMELLATDTKLRDTLIARGLKRAKLFTYETNIEKTIAMYKDLLDSHKIVYESPSGILKQL